MVTAFSGRDKVFPVQREIKAVDALALSRMLRQYRVDSSQRVQEVPYGFINGIRVETGKVMVDLHEMQNEQDNRLM